MWHGRQCGLRMTLLLHIVSSSAFVDIASGIVHGHGLPLWPGHNRGSWVSTNSTVSVKTVVGASVMCEELEVQLSIHRRNT